MLMRLTALLLFLFVSQNSQAAQIGKVFDGATVSCPPVEAVKPIAPETAMTATLNGQDLTVQINVCDGQQWKLDTSMPTHRYTAPDGKAVELRFAKFRLFVATANWAKHKFIPDRRIARIKKSTVLRNSRAREAVRSARPVDLLHPLGEAV